MQKKEHTRFDTHTLVFMALMAAMQIVLSRFVAIDMGFARITVSNVPVALAGLWFGPVAGGVTGFVADALGCFMKGYAINPLISLSTMMWGIIPVLMKPLYKGTKKRKTLFLCLSVLLTSIMSTLVLTTAGLVLMNGYNFFAIMPTRLVQWAACTPVYMLLTCTLYFSPLTALAVDGSAVRKAA